MAKAFKISGAIRGAKKFRASIEALKSECLAGQVKAVQESVFLIHSTAVQAIQDNSAGTPQVRYGPKRTVLASKPGTPPNTDTGRAAQSIKFDFKDRGLTGRIGTNLKYLAALEFGFKTKQGGVVKARPWLSYSIKVASKEVAEIFRRNVQLGVKKVAK